ncbi:MAG TPA: hypothetical protein VH023_17635 [Rhodopila sp.]|nr:hypothetical protein [Rhodopila sp.]
MSISPAKGRHSRGSKPNGSTGTFHECGTSTDGTRMTADRASVSQASPPRNVHVICRIAANHP